MRIELGGTDQRFNVLLGRDIQSALRQKTSANGTLLPLLEGTDGEVKNVKNLTLNMHSINDDPKNMFGKLMSIPDELNNALLHAFNRCFLKVNKKKSKLN